MTRTTPFGSHAAEDIAAFGGEGELTAEQLRSASLHVAKSLGPSRGSEVAVICQDRAAFVAALFGAWEAGATVALPPNAQPETLRDLRKHVRTVLHDRDDQKGIDVSPMLTAASLGPDAKLQPLDDTHRLAVYTSGSTGDPQRIEKPVSALLAEVDVLLRTFPQLEANRVLAIVPPHHIYGLLFGVLAPTLSGGAFHRRGPRDPKAISAAVAREGATVVVSVPAHLRSLRHGDLESLPPIGRIFSSGAPLPADTASAFARRARWPITEVLGSTETGGIAWRVREAESAPAWKPLEGVRVATNDEDLLELRSPFVPGSETKPYVGADRIRLLEDGCFEHLGRQDGVVKVGAMRVSVADLTRRIREVPGVEDAEVVAVDASGPRGVETWACVVAAGVDAPTIRAALAKWFAPVALPRRFRFTGRLPRDDNGKARRADLLALFDEPSPEPATPPVNGSTSASLDR